MSIALVGCMIGAMLCGWLADKIGRKRLLIASAAVFLLSSIATGAMNEFKSFIVARFFGGIAIGLASGLSPMYIAEISPATIRGKLVSLNQMTIVLGILGAQIVNWMIAEPIPSGQTNMNIMQSWNGQMAWRWMFWATAVPSLLFLVMVFFIPESPRWLTMKDRQSMAMAVWNKIGGQQYAQEELKSVKRSNAEKIENAGLSTLFSKPYHLVLLLGIVIAIFQQWCGTNVIFNYAQEIFQAAGYEIGEVLFNIVVTGVANVVFTFIALFTIDRLGRRVLMLIGASGLALIYLALGTCYYLHVTGIFMIVLVVLAIGCYAMTLGPCTWVLISELFPNRVRAVAVATCTLALWIGSSTLTFSFPMLNRSLGSYGTFWIYSAICICGFVFFLCLLPETKGKSLEDIEKELIKKEK